jgi:hypothetical protein
MYAFTQEITADNEVEPIEFAYWRKHNALHGWMESKWENSEEFVADESFNCVNFELSKEDLKELEELVTSEKLYSMGKGGFFFGSTNYEQDDIDYYKPIDLKFIEEAKEYLAEGNTVFYSSWW